MENYYLDCAATSHIGGDRRKFSSYRGSTEKDMWEVRDCAARVAGKGIGLGDVQERFRLPSGCDRIDDVVVRDVCHVEGARNSHS